VISPRSAPRANGGAAADERRRLELRLLRLALPLLELVGPEERALGEGGARALRAAAGSTASPFAKDRRARSAEPLGALHADRRRAPELLEVDRVLLPEADREHALRGTRHRVGDARLAELALELVEGALRDLDARRELGLRALGSEEDEETGRGELLRCGCGVEFHLGSEVDVLGPPAAFGGPPIR
jgi:hypothetical protein